MKTKLALIALISLTVFSCSTEDLQVENQTSTKELKINSNLEKENTSIFMRDGDSVNKIQDSTQIIPNPIPVIGEPIKPIKD